MVDEPVLRPPLLSLKMSVELLRRCGVVSFVGKYGKTNAFSSIGKMKADKTAKSFPTYRILVFSKFDRLDPSYQTSKKREFDRLEKPL